MKAAICAFVGLVASAAPAFAQDVYDAWDEEPEGYIVERRVTVETYVRPAYRAPDRRIYRADPAYVYEDGPYPYGRPRSHYVAVPYDHEDRECTVKRRWHHGRLIEKIRCD